MIVLLQTNMNYQQRSTQIQFRSPTNQVMRKRVDNKNTSVFLGSLYRNTFKTNQLSQSRELCLVIGTDEEFVNQFISELYETIKMKEIRSLIIPEEATFIYFQERMQEVIKKESFSYIILPVINSNVDYSLNRLFEKVDYEIIADHYFPASYELTFESIMQMHVLENLKELGSIYLPNYHLMLADKPRLLILSTSLLSSCQQMISVVSTCSISESGIAYGTNDCTFSTSVMGNNQLKQHIQFYNILSTLKASLSLTTAYSEFEQNVQTDVMIQVITQSAIISNIKVYGDIWENFYEPGRGYGYLDQQILLAYVKNNKTNIFETNGYSQPVFEKNNISFNESFNIEEQQNLLFQEVLVNILICDTQGQNITISEFFPNSNCSALSNEKLRNFDLRIRYEDIISNEYLVVSQPHEHIIKKRIDVSDNTSSIIIPCKEFLGISVEGRRNFSTGIEHADNYRLALQIYAQKHFVSIKLINQAKILHEDVQVVMKSFTRGKHYLYSVCNSHGIDTTKMLYEYNISSDAPIIEQVDNLGGFKYCQLFFCYYFSDSPTNNMLQSKFCAHTDIFQRKNIKISYFVCFCYPMYIILQVYWLNRRYKSIKYISY